MKLVDRSFHVMKGRSEAQRKPNEIPSTASLSSLEVCSWMQSSRSVHIVCALLPLTFGSNFSARKGWICARV